MTMRRHTPTLYTHQEDEADDEDDGNWSTSSRHTFTPPSTIHTTATKSRPKIRQQRSTFSPNPTAGPSNYSHIYNQFVRRYRPGVAVDDDPRSDPESHYYNRGLGQLLDGGDSDEEDVRSLSSVIAEGHDRLSALMLDAEAVEPETLEDRERLEWQTMLASVLAGDVLRAENTRIAVALKTSMEEENSLRANLWLGIQAKLHGTTEAEERKRMDERRVRIVDATIKEVLDFRVSEPPANFEGSAADHALIQVNSILRRIEIAHALYPSLRCLYIDHPAATSTEFQQRRDTLNTWSTVITSLRQNIDVQRKWTGSETLDVTQPTSNPPIPFHGAQLPGEKPGGTAFVERLLKEESIQRQFEKGSMTTIHALVGTTRDAHVNLAPMFRDMNLPSFEQELVPLVSFLTNLAQAVLRVRLDYAQKLKNPDILIIDQMTEDLKVKIGFACALKRQYEAFLLPDPGGNWKLPPCISDDYDSVILEALTFFFKLIHWKLKSGLKGIHFKETDVMEAQWATFSDVSLSIPGGPSLVAEQLGALTNKLMVRVTNYFDTQIRIPIVNGIQKSTREAPNGALPGSRTAFTAHLDSVSSDKPMTQDQMLSWYGKILEGVKQRYRKLQRLTRFSNSAEYDLEEVPMDLFVSALVETDHCLVYTRTWEEEGTYIIAHPSLRDRPETIRRIMMEAFHVTEADEDMWFMDTVDHEAEEEGEASYILVLSPRTRFLWNGLVLMLQIPTFDLRMADNRVRLIADGPVNRLTLAQRQFSEIFLAFDEDGDLVEPALPPLTCLIEAQAHLPSVNHELKKISRATNRLAESIVNSVHHVRDALREASGYQELLENWYAFASEHGQHVQKYMDHSTLHRFNRLLIELAISWVSFICDDCDPNDRKTFRWAVSALEFTLHRTRRNNILHLPDEQFEMLRQKVATCMTLLISHFDILGARSTLEAKREKERQEELLRQNAADSTIAEVEALLDEETGPSFTDPAVRMFWDRTSRAVKDVEAERALIGAEQHTLGRVLDEEKLVDKSLVFLAGSRSNISIRWQQGRFIGAGSFGSVYLAVNLDSGSLMAVKEIRFQEVAGLSTLYSQIKDELSVMEMLHHPNVVEYYGIEVHRDKVYIFEEYCQGGSLAALLEHGRIEDEGIIQVYTMQLLEGLAYLHSKGVLHRDIKPDNILLDHMGVIKYVDFGAAKILARNQRTIQRSRRATDVGQQAPGVKAPITNNSLTGTPMYMSPEVIRNNTHGRMGAMDVWSLGCVVLECATGRKPWSNVDNEWAIMFRIGVATQHPPLPEPGQLSELGIDFIKQCLIIDPSTRPSALELMDHPWMVDFSEALRSYEEAELATSPPMEMPSESQYKAATVARQAAIMQEKEVENIASASPSLSPLETPSDSDNSPGLECPTDTVNLSY
ncbi:Suppressor of Sensor Kinase (SLN1) [Steccherinum ochraceum]|uniref:Suppressor of Sensor Kinase (SLN1) n=1 Tax=Steccherinum ochraceum TaxID=92696 RepID=A0A4R0RVC3_9APHY|nr:Suppressor of Sensor Kinase (SLN1) [Steccherinum ochraceum]